MYKFSFYLFLLFSLGTVFADENTLRHVRTLADRGQFVAVETFCQEQFERTDVAEVEKTALATELVRSRSMQLLTIEPAQRSRLLHRLQSLETDWLQTGKSKSSELALAQVTLRLQLAMAYCSLGNYQRLEADIAQTTLQPQAYQQARSTLHDAIERIKKCQQELQTFRMQLGLNADSPLLQSISALESSITMQQGIAQKFLALTFSSEAERNFELRRAIETLDVLASKESTEPVIVQCKIEKAICHRLGGELDKCRNILLPLLSLPQEQSRLLAETEWIRLLIAEGKISEARQQYMPERAETKFNPDFNLARLELLLASDLTRNIRPEHARAARLQETMERELGIYWGRRARMTVIALSGSETELNSAEMLATLAENQYREGRFAESAELYEQAAAKADANRQAEHIFQYRRLAIAAWNNALENLLADVNKAEYRNRLFTLLRSLSVQNPNHAEAEQLHLAAIDLQRQMAAEQPENLAEYTALVKEHLTLWTESPQLQRLRRLLVILLERQGQLDEAATLLPLLDQEQLGTLTPEIQRLQVRRLDSEGKTQEAVNLLTALLKQKREPVTLHLFAEILSQQSDKKSLQYALDFWLELERGLPKNTELWWISREGIIEVLYKLDRKKEAEESYKMLRTLYPDLGGTERKERLGHTIN